MKGTPPWASDASGLGRSRWRLPELDLRGLNRLELWLNQALNLAQMSSIGYFLGKDLPAFLLTAKNA